MKFKINFAAKKERNSHFHKNLAIKQRYLGRLQDYYVIFLKVKIPPSPPKLPPLIIVVPFSIKLGFPITKRHLRKVMCVHLRVIRGCEVVK